MEREEEEEEEEFRWQFGDVGVLDGVGLCSGVFLSRCCVLQEVADV